MNAGINADFFGDNKAQLGQRVAYDGFTTNLTAFAVVVPGKAYHFKTAVADVADAAFESGVMLEAFSFHTMGGLSIGMNGATGQLAPTAHVCEGRL